MATKKALTCSIALILVVCLSVQLVESQNDKLSKYRKLCKAAIVPRATFEYLKSKMDAVTDSHQKSQLVRIAAKYEAEHLSEQAKADKFAELNELKECMADESSVEQGKTKGEAILKRLQRKQMGAIQRDTEGSGIFSFML